MLKLTRIPPSAALSCLPLAICLLTSGCADNPSHMVPDLARANTIPASVNVKVTGGKESNPGALTNLSDKEFITAVQLSLEKAGTFAAVKRDGPGDYQMEIVFTSNEPAAGFTMTVQIHASWMLIQRSTDVVVWKQSIDSTCTKTVGDAFAGGSRLIMAEEGAIKENIRLAFDSLAKADLTTK